jgi:hypothetical protein
MSLNWDGWMGSICKFFNIISQFIYWLWFPGIAGSSWEDWTPFLVFLWQLGHPELLFDDDRFIARYCWKLMSGPRLMVPKNSRGESQFPIRGPLHTIQ